MRNLLFTVLAALVMVMTSCTGDGTLTNEYCGYRASYYIDFMYGHTNTPLHDALSDIYGNTFVMFSVESDMQNGKDVGYKLVSQLCNKEKQTEIVREEILVRPTRLIGLNNGLIVGHSALQDGMLYVFDQMCPNCFKATNLTRNEYKVKLVNNGTEAHCGNCKRSYGLLNGGVVVSDGGGDKLLRYHASYNGTVFFVSNPQ